MQLLFVGRIPQLNPNFVFDYKESHRTGEASKNILVAKPNTVKNDASPLPRIAINIHR